MKAAPIFLLGRADRAGKGEGRPSLGAERSENVVCWATTASGRVSYTMIELAPQGQRVANDLSARYGFSVDAVTHMMVAVLEGNGSMAQFNHPEFAGSGQWMSGGMIMLGDMFNNALKGRIDGLCHEIAGLLQREPGLLRTGSFQSQSQSGGSGQQQQGSGSMGFSSGSSLFVPDPAQNWWPKDLGAPAATGAQNNVRYAYFPQARRLAVDTMGDVWVYDTQDHQIGGFSQQQGFGGSILFQSQYGAVNLSALPVVSRNGAPVSTPPAQNPSAPPHSATQPSSEALPSGPDAVALLERLGDLRAKGVITEEEFQTKKAELLGRI